MGREEVIGALVRLDVPKDLPRLLDEVGLVGQGAGFFVQAGAGVVVGAVDEFVGERGGGGGMHGGDGRDRLGGEPVQDRFEQGVERRDFLDAGPEGRLRDGGRAGGWIDRAALDGLRFSS
jgi:hypothetical protein